MRKAVNQIPGDKAQFLLFWGVEKPCVLYFLMPAERAHTGIPWGDGTTDLKGNRMSAPLRSLFQTNRAEQ